MVKEGQITISIMASAFESSDSFRMIWRSLVIQFQHRHSSGLDTLVSRATSPENPMSMANMEHERNSQRSGFKGAEPSVTWSTPFYS